MKISKKNGWAVGYGKNNVVENGNADMIGHSFWSMKLLFKLFFDGIIFGMIPQSLVIVPSQSFLTLHVSILHLQKKFYLKSFTNNLPLHNLQPSEVGY